MYHEDLHLMACFSSLHFVPSTICELAFVVQLAFLFSPSTAKSADFLLFSHSLLLHSPKRR
jgi:hypothetical protein